MNHMAKCTYPSMFVIMLELALIRGVFGIEHELDRFYQSLKLQLALMRPQSGSMASIHLNPIFEEYE